MATAGVGVDVVDVPRFELAITRHPRLLERVFTEGERRDARGRAERLAARFAAKEAVMKTLGVGLGSTPWQSIEVVKERSGAPRVVLHGPAIELAKKAGVASMRISLSHTAMTAVAFVVGSTEDERAG